MQTFKSSISATLLVACIGCANAAQVGEWTYLLTPGNIGRTTSMVGSRNGYTNGQAELFEEGEKQYFFRLRGVTADECLNVKIPASVEVNETEMVVTPGKRFPTCPSIRLVIRRDGKGGVVQQLVGRKGQQSWQTDEDHEYGLVAKD